jgi:hypothetical protein
VISGSLVQRFWVDVNASPGNANPAVHRDTGTHRDDTGDIREGGATTAPTGGNAVPQDVLMAQIPVLDGTPGAPNTSHRADNTHKGLRGLGMGRAQYDLDQPLEDRQGGMHMPATLATAGLGGAAFGGRVKTGSMEPEANPGGVDLGHRYRPVTLRRRQNLHFNLPGLRAIRGPVRTYERPSPHPEGSTRTSLFDPTGRYSQGGGPSMPRLRRLLRPVGSDSSSMDAIDQVPASAVVLDAGPVGTEWVR